MNDFLNVPVWGQEVALQVFGAGKETVKQVDHVPVGIRTDNVLRVKASRKFQSEALIRFVLHSHPRFRTEARNGAVVLHAQARIDDPITAVHAVVHIPSKFRRILYLSDLNANGVERLEVRLHPNDLQAILHGILTQYVLKIQPKIEAVYGAVPVLEAFLFEPNFIIACGKVSIHQDRRATGHNGKISATAVVGPAQVRKGLVIHLVGKIETEQAQF